MSYLHGAMRFHIKRIKRMGTSHVEPIVLRAAEGEIGAALRQLDKSKRLALRVEYHDAVEVFRLALKLVNLAAADIGRLALQGAIAAPAAPQVAVAIDPESVERALVCRVDELGFVAERPVGINVIAPDAAVGRALPFDDVQLLLVRRECQTVGVDKVRDHGRELAVRGEVKHIGISLLWAFLVAFPFA